MPGDEDSEIREFLKEHRDVNDYFAKLHALVQRGEPLPEKHRAKVLALIEKIREHDEAEDKKRRAEEEERKRKAEEEERKRKAEEEERKRKLAEEEEARKPKKETSLSDMLKDIEEFETRKVRKVKKAPPLTQEEMNMVEEYLELKAEDDDLYAELHERFKKGALSNVEKRKLLRELK